MLDLWHTDYASIFRVGGHDVVAAKPENIDVTIFTEFTVLRGNRYMNQELAFVLSGNCNRAALDFSLAAAAANGRISPICFCRCAP
jgi:hypothetical protein